MKNRNSKSFIACLMAALMLIGTLSGLSLAIGEEANSEGYELIQMDKVTVAGQKTNTIYAEEQEEETIDPTTPVTVIVEVEGDSVLETYGTLEEYQNGMRALTAKGENIQDALLTRQKNVASSIESALGIDINVKYNYTLAYNGFAFEVPYGELESIKAIDGVVNVQPSPIYDLPEAVKGESSSGTKNYSAADMVYAFDAWSAGYDGEGMLVAVLDTGLDTDHEAFMNAPEKLKLDTSALETIFNNCNLQAEGIVPGLTAQDVYLRDKVPFAFDYANKDTDVNHGASDHGSHVSGISVADPQEVMLGLEGCYCRGVAYKAQLAAMKVFPSSGGGCMWTDVMAALEDCVYIGADVANLS